MILIDIEKQLYSSSGNMQLEIEMHIKHKDLITIYGESGAGKTSTLRILSGLMNPDKGNIKINDNIWFDAKKKINIKPQKRNIGYVFQDYALFPNMTVQQNLKYAINDNQNKSLLSQLIDIIELGDLQHRHPETLSGGQKQRVALARALVQQPDILLLDEPFSALDLKKRLKLQDYLLKVHHEFNLTTILISHDISEINKLSNRVYIINNGKITKHGTPNEVFNKEKYNFTGRVLKIEKENAIFTITVKVQDDTIKIIKNELNTKNLKIGDKVNIAAEIVNPMLYKTT